MSAENDFMIKITNDDQKTTELMEKQQNEAPKNRLKKYGEKTELLKKLIQDTGLKQFNAIKKRWIETYPNMKPPSRSYFSEVMTKYFTTTTDTTPTEAPTESAAVVTEPTPEEIKNAEELTSKPLSEVVAGIQSGKITKKQIEALFRVENKIIACLLSDEYRHDDDTIDMLSGLWEQPLNRVFAKYADKNSDIYIAAVLTVFAHAPMILKLFKDYTKKPKGALKL